MVSKAACSADVPSCAGDAGDVEAEVGRPGPGIVAWERPALVDGRPPPGMNVDAPPPPALGEDVSGPPWLPADVDGAPLLDAADTVALVSAAEPLIVAERGPPSPEVGPRAIASSHTSKIESGLCSAIGDDFREMAAFDEIRGRAHVASDGLLPMKVLRRYADGVSP